MNIIGIGEILWDRLPGRKMLGGAPANFAYVANALGRRGVVLSRVGDDAAGREILDVLRKKNLSGEFIQLDARHRTGVVDVRFEADQPVYEIARPAAWDFLELTADWRELALRADAVCFGSLAQRSAVSGAAIREFVRLTQSLRIFDVNLRQHFFSRELVQNSLNLANIVKLNHKELPVVAEMFGIKSQNPFAAAKDLLLKFELRLVCVTREERGSLLVTENESGEHDGFKIELKDAIGAGDAFTAALAHGLLSDWSLSRINEFANKIGAFVASQTGAMPEFPKDLLSSRG